MKVFQGIQIYRKAIDDGKSVEVRAHYLIQAPGPDTARMLLQDAFSEEGHAVLKIKEIKGTVQVLPNSDWDKDWGDDDEPFYLINALIFDLTLGNSDKGEARKIFVQSDDMPTAIQELEDSLRPLSLVVRSIEETPIEGFLFLEEEDQISVDRRTFIDPVLLSMPFWNN